MLFRNSLQLQIGEYALALLPLCVCVCVDVAEWHTPSAGMFLWMKLKGIADTQQLIMEKALEKEVSTQTHTRDSRCGSVGELAPPTTWHSNPSAGSTERDLPSKWLWDDLLQITTHISGFVYFKVLLVPGGVFMINSSDPCPYVRAAFSLSTPEQIDEVYTTLTNTNKHTHTTPVCHLFSPQAFRRLSLLIKDAQWWFGAVLPVRCCVVTPVILFSKTLQSVKKKSD